MVSSFLLHYLLFASSAYISVPLPTNFIINATRKNSDFKNFR